jgi:SnoaL-like domain
MPGIIGLVDDAVARFCAASQANDMDALAATFTADVEVPSPLSGHLLFRGRDDVSFLLGRVYETVSHVRWKQPIGEGSTRLAVSEARVAGLRIDDAILFELDDSGLIRRISPHLRPWLATTVFALLVGPKVARRPGVLLRALRR